MQKHLAPACALLMLPVAGGCPSANVAEVSESGAGTLLLAGEATITAAQRSAVETVVSVAGVLGQVAALIAPVQDLEGILTQGEPLPNCPTMDVVLSNDPNAIELSLDYGTGCRSAYLPHMLTGGRVDGTYFIGVDAVELWLTGVGAAGNAIEGRVAGGFTPQSESTTFALNVNLTLDEGTSVKGHATMLIDEIAGTVTINHATVTVARPASSTLTVVFDDVTGEPGRHPLFPASGQAAFELSAETEDVTMMLEFTPQTPETGAVQIRVNAAATTTIGL